MATITKKIMAIQKNGLLITKISIFVFCLLTARVQILGGITPFGPALIAVVQLLDFFPVYGLLGCIAGRLLAPAWHPWAWALDIGGMLLLFGILQLMKNKQLSLKIPMIAVAASIFASLPQCLDLLAYDRAMMLLQGVVAGLMVPVFFVTGTYFTQRGKRMPYSREEVVCLVIGVGLLFSNFMSIHVFGISLSLIALCVLVLMGAYVGGMSMGSACGVAVGMFFSLMSGNPLWVGACTFCGLAAGLFKNGAKIYSAVAFYLASMLISFFFGRQGEENLFLVESGIAAVIFMFIPEKMFAFIENITEEKNDRVQSQQYYLRRMRDSAVQKLQDFSGAFSRVATDFHDPKAFHSPQQKKSTALILSQLNSVSSIVRSLASEMNMEIYFDINVEKTLRQKMKQASMRVREVTVQRNRQFYLVRLIKRSCGGRAECMGKVAEVVSSGVGKPMACTGKNCGLAGRGFCECTYEPKAIFDVRTGMAISSRQSEKPCGDSVLSQKLPAGKHLLAISDGMGSGEKAQDESQATLSWLFKFYEAGFSQEVVLNCINQLLILRSGEDMFTTADLCLFDLQKGMAEITKVGAAPSFIVWNGQADVLNNFALPMGILDKIEPVAQKINLIEGQLWVMMSDGVFEAMGEERIKAWLLFYIKKTDTPQQIAQQLLAHAKNISNHDDMTIAVARILSAS